MTDRLTEAPTPTLFQTERQREIATATLQVGRVEVADLADRFGVTTETIRRDLSELARPACRPPRSRRSGAVGDRRVRAALVGPHRPPRCGEAADFASSDQGVARHGFDHHRLGEHAVAVRRDDPRAVRTPDRDQLAGDRPGTRRARRTPT